MLSLNLREICSTGTLSESKTEVHHDHHEQRVPTPMCLLLYPSPHGSRVSSSIPEKIVKEMTDCHDRYGVGHFDLEDDNFTFDQERAKELMKRIIETFGERRLELTAMNGVSFASLDADLVQLMRRAGFHTVNLSFVSTAPSLKKQMGRPTADTTFGEILKKVEQAGLRTIAYAIFGMPGQTIEDMVDTSIYLMKKRVLMGPSIYYPTPRTPLFERCRVRAFFPPLRFSGVRVLFPSKQRSLTVSTLSPSSGSRERSTSSKARSIMERLRKDHLERFVPGGHGENKGPWTGRRPLSNG